MTWNEAFGKAVYFFLAHARRPARPSRVEEPMPSELSGMSAAELVILAEGRGAVFSLPGPGRVSIDYFGTSTRISPNLRQALQEHKEEVIAVLEQKMEGGEAL